ncbi:Ku protein [bacterium]|nr:Ku protein [bacterium]
MPARAAWKGFLQIHQLQIPVKTFSACSTQPEISLNQLHRDCGQRIRQHKVCPTHGEVDAADIIAGYACAEGQYLPIDATDLAQLQPEEGKAIAVDCFVTAQQIDPVYHSGRTYYVVPDGPPGQRPFGVLRDGMRQLERHAVSRVVMHQREYLVLLRPLGRLIAMTVLEYPQKVRSASEYEGDVTQMSVGSQEQQLIGQLIDSLTERDLDISRYRDRYIDGLNALIERKLAETGTTMMTATNDASLEAADEETLVAALRASLAAAGVDDLPPRIPSRTERTLTADNDQSLPKSA